MLTNEQEYNLLQKDPIELLTSEKYQNSIKKIVFLFFKKGFFKNLQPEDIIQDLNIIFLKRMFSIQKNYEPEFSKLTAYFERAVYNRCLELVKLKKNQIQHNTPVEDYHIGNTNNQGTKVFLLAKEQKLLKDYLRLYSKQSNKLLICLKIYARITLVEEDIRKYFPQISQDLLQTTIAKFQEYNDLSDQAVFQNIIAVIHECEQSKTSADSLRRWADEQVKEIVNNLSKYTQHSYNKESLRNLLKVLSEPPFVNTEKGIF